jgi:hypothetical protein
MHLCNRCSRSDFYNKSGTLLVIHEHHMSTPDAPAAPDASTTPLITIPARLTFKSRALHFGSHTHTFQFCPDVSFNPEHDVWSEEVLQNTKNVKEQVYGLKLLLESLNLEERSETERNSLTCIKQKMQELDADIAFALEQHEVRQRTGNYSAKLYNYRLYTEEEVNSSGGYYARSISLCANMELDEHEKDDEAGGGGSWSESWMLCSMCSHDDGDTDPDNTPDVLLNLLHLGLHWTDLDHLQELMIPDDVESNGCTISSDGLCGFGLQPLLRQWEHRVFEDELPSDALNLEWYKKYDDESVTIEDVFEECGVEYPLHKRSKAWVPCRAYWSRWAVQGAPPHTTTRFNFPVWVNLNAAIKEMREEAIKLIQKEEWEEIEREVESQARSTEKSIDAEQHAKIKQLQEEEEELKKQHELHLARLREEKQRLEEDKKQQVERVREECKTELQAKQSALTKSTIDVHLRSKPDTRTAQNATKPAVKPRDRSVSKF